MHIKYPKIHRLEKDECIGLLSEPVILQEKIDGANLSIWLEEDTIFVGSRTQIVGDTERKEGFNGAVQYCNQHEGIRKYLSDNPTHRMFGEWLVKHTINYPVEYYNKFYLFDILTPEGWLPTMQVVEIAKQYGIYYPEIFFEGMATIDIIKEYAGKSALGNVTGEGVVVKRDNFINPFGDRTHGKHVIEEFKEKNNIVFGNYTTDDLEMKFITSTIIEPRLLKLINKYEQNEGKKIAREAIGFILGTMYHDIFTEELWQFCKKNNNPTLDFKRIASLSQQRTKVLFFDYLETLCLKN